MSADRCFFAGNYRLAFQVEEDDLAIVGGDDVPNPGVAVHDAPGKPAGKCAHRSRSSARCSRSQSRSLGDTVLAASILASRRTNGSNGPGSKDVGGARSMKLAQDGGHLGGCPVAIRG